MKYNLSYNLITRMTAYLSRTIFYFRKTEINKVCNYLKDKKNIKILDYGCNSGYLLNIINNTYPDNFNLSGADINTYALKHTRKKYKNFHFYDLNEGGINNKKFDVIILSHVLEHIKNIPPFLKNLKKLLKSNGTLIILIPQERIRGDSTFFQLIYNILRLRFENPHVININYSKLKTMLTAQKMKITEHVYTNFWPPFKSKNKKIYSWSLVAMCKQNN